MMARAGSGWQTVLADLSLILFMVTASALSLTDAGPGDAKPASPRAEPMALWRAGARSPALREWLADAGADPRQQLTIVSHYAPGGMEPALARAQALARQAQAAGMAARVIVEPGDSGVAATLAYDAPSATLARDLLDRGH